MLHINVKMLHISVKMLHIDVKLESQGSRQLLGVSTEGFSLILADRHRMSTVTKLYFTAIVKIATHNLHCGVLSHFTPLRKALHARNDFNRMRITHF
jgi:hypothetical protein